MSGARDTEQHFLVTFRTVARLPAPRAQVVPEDNAAARALVKEVQDSWSPASATQGAIRGGRKSVGGDVWKLHSVYESS